MEHENRLLLLAPGDNVLVARVRIGAGETLGLGLGVQSVRVQKTIPLGYKIAARAVAAGEKIIKYGAPIGSATCPIEAGEIVHTHNLQSDYLPTYEREKERFVDEH